VIVGNESLDSIITVAASLASSGAALLTTESELVTVVVSTVSDTGCSPTGVFSATSSAVTGFAHSPPEVVPPSGDVSGFDDGNA
jgi:hypothetical protein